MPFIGNQPALSYTSFAKQDFTTSATTSYTLDNPVANANELALFINFVRQEPGSYSASGTTLTLTEATSSSDDMYCVYLGKAVQTVNPPNASVGTSQLASTLDLSSKTITLASNMTNTPVFHANLSSSQSVGDNTYTKIQFNSETIDTNNAYDNSTNYRFTVPSGQGGKYYIYVSSRSYASATSNLQDAYVAIYKNGSRVHEARTDFRNNFVLLHNVNVYAILDLSEGDYIEGYGVTHSANGSGSIISSDENSTFIGGFKLI